MAQRIIDELKIIKQEADESVIRKTIIDFFDEMEVDDVPERTKLAMSLEKIVRNILLLALAGEMAREQLIDQFIREYSMAVINSGYRPNYAHIERVCADIVDNTLKGIETPYLTSTDRSILIAETETNNTANNDEYQEALENSKTEKIWHTMADNKVRQTHRDIDGATIPINDLFQVGEAEMRFPCDEEYAYDYPSETCNCRCHISYR